MKHQKVIVRIFLIFCVVAALSVFVVFQHETTYPVSAPEYNGELESLDQWSLEDSLVNGAPLVENKNIYISEAQSKLTYVYITVFPTKDEQGKVLNFSAFDLHKARDKTYNPILNANVQFVDHEGGLDVNKNLETVNATIKVRGNSSRGAKYKSYKVKMKDGAETFEGQSILNLNKHVSDVSKISNKFCMDLMAPMENMASFRTNFMIVYIRDASLPKAEQEYQYYGLYTHVEQPNKSYLKARGMDSGGSLYKANNFEFRLTDELKEMNDPSYNEEEFETVLKIRESKSHTKLLQMLNDINDMNQDFEEVFAKYFNEDNYLSWVASNILLGNEDTIAHNFLIYNPTNSLTWYMFPWDYDGTFKFGEYRSGYQVPITLAGIQRMSGVLLHRRYLKQPGNIDKLTARLQELMAGDFSAERIQNLVDQYKPIMEKTLPLPPDIYCCNIPLNEYNAYLDQFDDQIKINYDRYMESLEYPMPVFVSEPVIDENGILFAWEPSFDYQGDLITYNIKLSGNLEMTDVILEEQGLLDNTYQYEGTLQPGNYYLAVSITDTQGHEQCSLDFTSGPSGGMVFGVREITIP